MGETPNSISLEILMRSRVFQAAAPGDLERLALRCSCERYRRGGVIMRLGVSGDSLMVIGRGRVKATLPSPNADGEFIVGLFWPGEVFGEVAVFDDQARHISAVAVTEAEVLFVPRNELLALMERRPAVATRLLEAVCEKLRAAVELSVSIRFLDVQSRFYRRLVHLGRYDSKREGVSIRIQHGLSQRELADSIGASREALNKLFGDWKRAGLLEYGRGFVVVKDPAALSMRLPPALRQGPGLEACSTRPLETVPA